MKKFNLLFLVISCYTFLYSNSIKEILKNLDNIKTLKSNIVIDDRLNAILYYKKPNQIHIKFSDGRIIASNGIFLWFYSPINNIAGKQSLKKEATYGLKGLFSEYKNIETLGQNEFKLIFSEKRLYEEVIFSLDQKSNFLRLLIMKNEKRNMRKKLTFSNTVLNLGLSTSLFDYNPIASAQLVTNPLNH